MVKADYVEKYGLARVSGPSVEPLASTDAIAHTRASTDDSNLLSDLITAAREYTEGETGRTWVNTTWRLTLEDWPDGDVIELPRSPLNSTGLSVKYIKEDGSTATLGSTKYTIDTDSLPGRVVLKDDESWPTDVLRNAAPVRVQFIAGYSTSSTSVPETARAAMKLLIGDWYRNREATVIGQTARQTEFAVDALLASLKVPSVA